MPPEASTVTDMAHCTHVRRHESFRLDCKEYEALVTRASGRCEVCAEPNEALMIDHDHILGRWAVRGLACQSCNLRLARVDGGFRYPTAAEWRYLVNPFHLSLPAVRPRSPRGQRRYRRPRSPYGQARCPWCRRTVNRGADGWLQHHSVRVGRDADLHGSTGCRGRHSDHDPRCLHGSLIYDRENRCTTCWKCNCISSQAPNCPVHGIWERPSQTDLED